MSQSIKLDNDLYWDATSLKLDKEASGITFDYSVANKLTISNTSTNAKLFYIGNAPITLDT